MGAAWGQGEKVEKGGHCRRGRNGGGAGADDYIVDEGDGVAGPAGDGAVLVQAAAAASPRAAEISAGLGGWEGKLFRSTWTWSGKFEQWASNFMLAWEG